jgi:carbon storage regulator CsrA
LWDIKYFLGQILLIINRTPGQTIMIGDNLRITLLDIQGKQIQLGLEDLANKTIFPTISAEFNQKIQMGNGGSILVVQVRGKQVKLGIDFPPNILVLRGELYEK